MFTAKIIRYDDRPGDGKHNPVNDKYYSSDWIDDTKRIEVFH
jgi:hypothetical protein